ncbi:MFS transporter [Rhodocytophaga aerolata]|uniref:MFS transporter n=1 Tax=Rhodocytophaga aerolata TaxID=455078 RepID=A0ABT8R013_9BACT|nr:MFS transporter [Rhodocytophaga aerolata]MDO1445431.1 MFS transporter [Rhodocytophaga aerolata]
MKVKSIESNKWELKLTLLLVSSLTIMSVITISPALPQMAQVFSSVENAEFLVKLVLTLPALLIALFSPITGRLIDRHGRLRILWMALVLYALSGSAGYFLNNLYHILISRALLGMSVGMSMTIVITLIADYFEGIERQQFVGLQIAFMSLGGILFIGLGGILADAGWQYPFLIYLFSLVVLPLSIRYLYEPSTTQNSASGNAQAKAPSIIWLLFFNTMLMWVIFFLIPVQIPFHLKAIGIEKNSLIGAAIAMSTAFSALSSFSYAKLKSRFSFLAVFSIGYLLMAAGYICVALSNTYMVVLVGMMLSGLGMGMMIPNTNMWVMTIVPPQIRGKEMGKLTTFWFLGQFLSPVIIFPVLQIVSISSTFMLASGFLFLISVGFFVLSISKTGKALTP